MKKEVRLNANRIGWFRANITGGLTKKRALLHRCYAVSPAAWMLRASPASRTADDRWKAPK
jgi:hypothetical protein